jgi:restriction system protein
MDSIQTVRPPSRSELIAQCIAQHEQTLAKKRWQLVQRNEYRNEDTQKWNKEKKYFINTVLIPYVTGHNYSSFDKKQLKQLYVEFDGAVERGAQGGLTSLPASNTIANITNGHEYERFCADLLSKSGWETRVTKASGDQGVDIIAHYNGLRGVFQCKFYSSPVGNSAVQEVVTAKIHEQADLAVVISTTTYTKSAEMLAGTTNTILIHHDDIPALKEKIADRIPALKEKVVNGIGQRPAAQADNPSEDIAALLQAAQFFRKPDKRQG